MKKTSIVRGRYVAYTTVSLFALLSADASQAQQYARVPSVEVNLQALQELKARVEAASRFAVGTPPKVEAGTIRSKKIYPPGYDPKITVSKAAGSSQAKKRPSRHVAEAKQPVSPPLVTVRRTESGYIPPVGRSLDSPSSRLVSTTPQKPARKVPELNLAYVQKKPQTLASPPAVTVKPSNDMEAIPKTFAKAARPQQAVNKPIQNTSPQLPSAQRKKTTKAVLHDMLDMPPKLDKEIVPAENTLSAEAEPRIAERQKTQPAAVRSVPARVSREVDVPVVKEVRSQPAAQPKPVTAAITPPASENQGLSDWNPPSVGGAPVVYAKRAPMPPAPKLKRKKLLPAIRPEEPKKKEVVLPDNLIDPFKTADSTQPLMKADEKVTRKKLFDKNPQTVSPDEVLPAPPAPEKADAPQEIPNLDDVPDLPVPPAPTKEKELIADEELGFPDIPAYEALPDPTETTMSDKELLPDFEQGPAVALETDLPALPDFGDSQQTQLSEPAKEALPSLDALTQDEELFEPLPVVEEPVSVPTPSEVTNMAKEVPPSVLPEVKIAAPSPEAIDLPPPPIANETAIVPEVEIAIPEMPEPAAIVPALPDFEAPIPTPVVPSLDVPEVAAEKVNPAESNAVNQVNELVPDFPDLPSVPDAPVELAALPDLNDVTPKLPEAPSAVAAAAQISFGKGEKTVEQALEQRIMQLAEEAKAGNKNIQVIAYASGGPEEASSARRISLARALDIRALLIQNGISEDRISLQALGNRESGSEDRADIFLR